MLQDNFGASHTSAGLRELTGADRMESEARTEPRHSSLGCGSHKQCFHYHAKPLPRSELLQTQLTARAWEKGSRLVPGQETQLHVVQFKLRKVHSAASSLTDSDQRGLLGTLWRTLLFSFNSTFSTHEIKNKSPLTVSDSWLKSS